eukprot:CAMPEP_0175100388 /NCGR_PEP_ID=MMETSP0086_2-20121207/7076_1 /TAXON_ID=136419 /ORGANISM="Unknown Unknown, Strain D1" /LENGTH=253 /DNA_ID=CAMNT_0016374527 /DNA_START=84 /DNA_END=842 /DNA_ORIENTATION=+
MTSLVADIYRETINREKRCLAANAKNLGDDCPMTWDRFGQPVPVATNTIREWGFWYQWYAPEGKKLPKPPPQPPRVDVDNTPTSPPVIVRRVAAPWALSDNAPSYEPSGEYCDNWYKRNSKYTSNQSYSLPIVAANYDSLDPVKSMSRLRKLTAQNQPRPPSGSQTARVGGRPVPPRRRPRQPVSARHLFSRDAMNNTQKYMKQIGFRNTNYPTPRNLGPPGSKQNFVQKIVPYCEEAIPVAKGRAMTDVTVW